MHQSLLHFFLKYKILYKPINFSTYILENFFYLKFAFISYYRLMYNYSNVYFEKK